ncbi:hypothetical protein BLNAU_5106 [Blattamonas nauphoetae]|uniref:Uncharacterized protein n=1 Tax=Blattamonas nauphoetae TaxID=2049346 RepID=A0ABQ9Y890_9EUKA|nr:hypothetical protein BLNAU_5106 [Blattamonas nauphoetae]
MLLFDIIHFACGCPDVTSTSTSLCIRYAANTQARLGSSTIVPSRCGVNVISGTFARMNDFGCCLIVCTVFVDADLQLATTSPVASSVWDVLGGSSKGRRKMSVEVSGLEVERATLA